MTDISGSWEEQYPSKYYQQADLMEATRRRAIGDVVKATMPDGAVKPVLQLVGDPKGVVVNKFNAQVLTELFGPHPRDCIGKEIELYRDPNVMFAGKRVGAVRIRAPKQQQQQAIPQLPPAAASAPAPAAASAAAPRKKKKGGGGNSEPQSAPGAGTDFDDDLPASFTE